MKLRKSLQRKFPILGLFVAACFRTAETHAVDAERFVLENTFLSRTVSIEGGVLHTTEIVNKRANAAASPTATPEFRLRFSQGTDKPDTQFTLTAADFKVTKAKSSKDGLVFSLANAANGIGVDVQYELQPDEFYAHKRLTITSAKPVVLERIEVEAFTFADAYQPYTVRDITANAPRKWSPGLGQPLYTSNSATFWGIEFPAADNQVKNGELAAGYLRGRELKAGEAYESYAAVVGVADDPAFVSEAFFDYINRTRVRPLRLQVQYNTWFDQGRGVRKETFTNSVAKLYDELVQQRGNQPLSMHVIDDGWQDVGASWSDNVWKVNNKFDPDFATSLNAVRSAGSKLGLWLSPGCLFGASGQVGKLRAQGFEGLDNWMSMAGPKYMQLLEDRMVELTKQGVGFFKLDGVFGHLNLRNFELHGATYGLPEMPQLELDGFTAGDPRLNDSKYDELKIYYLSAGTERLMQLFARLAKENPDIYIIISNGAYLSPWWLGSVDAIWMINAGDAAGGSSRTGELTYRDGVYHEIWAEQHTQFPLCSIFNHEPKKTTTGESKDEFRRYLYMHLSRGTGFIELYIKPFVLQPGDWDVISEGLQWAREIFPTFARARMHGGNPNANEVYGYTAWNELQGYITLHNPSTEMKTYSVQLDRAFGLVPGSGPFLITSPIEDSTRGLPESCGLGDPLAFELKPREIRVLNFTIQPKDWSKLRELQTRSPETLSAMPQVERPKAKPVPQNVFLGRWDYKHGSRSYARIFTADGICTMFDGEKVNWTKPYRLESPTRAIVDGKLVHEIEADGTLDIEGRFTATRRGNEK